MENINNNYSEFYNITKKTKITLWKRLRTYFVDFAFFLILYFALFYGAGVFGIEAMASDAIEGMNERIVYVCEQYDYPYKAGSNFGIYEIDEEVYIDKLQAADPSLTEAEGYDIYFEAQSTQLADLSNDANYILNYSKFHTSYLFVDAVCMLLPNIIFVCIIPIYDKENRTLGMKIFKQSLVNTKDERAAYKYKHIMRFVILFTECFVTKVVFNYWAFLALPLMELVIIISTPKKLSIFDAISFTRVIETDTVDRTEEGTDIYTPSN